MFNNLPHFLYEYPLTVMNKSDKGNDWADKMILPVQHNPFKVSSIGNK